MPGNSILNSPDADTLSCIRIELGEDPKRLEKQIELFKEWLRCEPHLPKDVDDHLVENFIRQCKCDLEKAKRKFEKFLAARIKLKDYFLNRQLNHHYFDCNKVHRQAIAHPILTPNGYRIGFSRLPENVDEFDFPKLFHYALVWIDFILLEDTSAGYIGVFDLKNFTPQHLAKINLKLLTEAINLIYNVAPFRFKAMHFLNVPGVPDTLIALLKKLCPEKLQKRVYRHKDVKDLHHYIPIGLLPKDFGGESKSLDEMADDVKDYFIRGNDWEDRAEKLKLTGGIPLHKRDVYSFEDFEMGGSFRQLTID